LGGEEGGPKEDLNALVKEWWIWRNPRRVTPLYKWIPREDNTLADELSKQAALTHALKPDAEQAVRTWLTRLGEPGIDRNHWLQTRVQCPLFDRIEIRVQEMRRAHTSVHRRAEMAERGVEAGAALLLSTSTEVRSDASGVD
jgi:hypothetical protein